jgi:hypothetical protein
MNVQSYLALHKEHMGTAFGRRKGIGRPAEILCKSPWFSLRFG